MTNEQLVTALSAKSVIEIAELVKELEAKWGVSAAAPVMVAGAAAGGAPAEEKTAFDVILVEGGANKINVIKEVQLKQKVLLKLVTNQLKKAQLKKTLKKSKKLLKLQARKLLSSNFCKSTLCFNEKGSRNTSLFYLYY
jgi:large subunit ribosomal protein L7/L12